MKKTDIQYVNDKLQVLVNQPMRNMFRFLDMLCMKFGCLIEVDRSRFENEKKHVEKEVIGEYALHIQSFYRLTMKQSILFASQDAFSASNEAMAREDFDYETIRCMDKGNNRLDEIINEFFTDLEGFIVKRIKMNAFCDLTIEFTNGMRLQTMTDITDGSECWRFFKHKDDERHIVVLSSGVLQSDDEPD